MSGSAEVLLLWLTDSDALCVRVHDSRGDDFELVVGATEAMDVFHHPYAYAAARGIDYGLPDHANAVTVHG